MNTLKEIIETDLSTQLGSRTRSKVFGLEYSGACPWCQGTNRFHVWPDAVYIPGVGTLGRYHCMGAEAGRGGCGRKGDGLHYLQEYRGLGFTEACKLLDIDPKALIDYRRAQKGLPPSEKQVKPRSSIATAMGDSNRVWQERADSIVALAQRRLASCDEAIAYLHSRGLQNTINDAELGYCPDYVFDEAVKWGYEPTDKVQKVLLPKGIVIPWRDAAGRVVCVRFRRLPSDESQDARDYYGTDERTGEIKRYRALVGSSSQHLYRGETLYPKCDVVLLEGELDALATVQSTDGSVEIVATGSTAWARSEKNVRSLAACSKVLIAYNADATGDKASEHWLTVLKKNARRWRPLWSDANDMLKDGINVGEWLTVGFSTMDASRVDVDLEASFTCSICHMNLDTPDPDVQGYYDENGISFCAEHWHRKKALDVTEPIIGAMYDVKVSRRGTYTFEQHVARLDQETRDKQRWNRLSPPTRRDLAGVQ